MKANYNRRRMAEALEKAGLKRGDVIFSHSNVGYFGLPEEGQTPEAVFQTIFGAFEDVIGKEGTLVVPTFTYSFCKGQLFDTDHTPSTCGIFTEMLRAQPEAHRSNDPIFSVVAVGRLSKDLTHDISTECFGKDSFWDRFLKANGIICNLNLDAGSTFVHYVERCLNVPYRYDKLFTGFFVTQGQYRKGAAIYYCHDLSNPDTVAAFEPFDALARKRGLALSVPVGRGAIVRIRSEDVYQLIQEELKINPWFLTASVKTGRAPILVQPSNTARFGISLSSNASMEQIIQALWKLPRDIVSDGYDASIETLSKQVPMKIHEYPTGSRCWTWIVPEKWTCDEAYLETLDGRRLFSYADNPLHVVSYSLPFMGEVKREVLSEHLHVHPRIPEAIPFVFKYYERDWGLCCSKRLKDSLTDERYRVVIKTKFSHGMLKVGEVVVPGKNEESIVLCAHLCHPAAANDGLSGVIVGLEAIRELLKRGNLRYTYRFLILPETIGSLAYLSHNEDLIPKIKGGLYLEALGLPNPHALQLSFDGSTEIDTCFMIGMKERDSHSWTGAFRSIIGNDERQFNAPGVRVPMLSLSRVLPPLSNDWPYIGYHSSYDTPRLVSIKSLEESRDLVLYMIETLENNHVPVNQFKGEIFLSRYGLHLYSNPEDNRALFNIIDHIDGTKSLAEIAEKCGVSFGAVKKVGDELHKHGLIKYTEDV